MNINDLTLFIHTADSGSITRAAEQLDISSATASAALKRLEKQLQVQLFIRTTRQLRITAEGERFLLYCRKAIATLNMGKTAIHAIDGKVAGNLTISIPSDLGRNMLLDWIDEIMDSHPNLSFKLLLGDSLADFYLDKVDLAIRYGDQPDSSMVAFELATIERILVASPAYLAIHGVPQTPYELIDHNCLLFQLNNRIDKQWEFFSCRTALNEKIKINVDSNRSANDGDVVKRWAIAGKGIAYKSRLDIAADLLAGRLIRVLPDYQSKQIALNLLCPNRQQITPAVLLLRDILRAKFAELHIH
ncbi:MAG: LysR family transcriptional regulator [Oceanospirillaceae bacterium]